jgi:hypothetical protein
MVELTRRAAMDTDLTTGIRAQMVSLENLLAYLEDRGQLGAKEYLFCQARLQDIVKQLRRLERQLPPDQAVGS